MEKIQREQDSDMKTRSISILTIILLCLLGGFSSSASADGGQIINNTNTSIYVQWGLGNFSAWTAPVKIRANETLSGVKTGKIAPQVNVDIRDNMTNNCSINKQVHNIGETLTVRPADNSPRNQIKLKLGGGG